MKIWIPVALIAIVIAIVIARGVFPGENGSKSDASTDAPKRGRLVFTQHCYVCHSDETDEVKVGPSLKGFRQKKSVELSDGSPFLRSDEAIRAMIEKGNTNMPPIAGDLTNQQIEDVIAYLHTL